jgi:hypothetical protein
MKTALKSIYMQIAAIALILGFGVTAYAESPRDELAHAYQLLRVSNENYNGHREAAMHEIERAGKDLGVELEGRGGIERESQWKSDRRISEARRLLQDAREKMEGRDRERVAERLDRAVKELDAALAK